MNVYLFEKNVSPLQIQKNNRELEMIVQECILTAIRESIPTEAIIRAYMDESIEEEEEVFVEAIKEPVLEGQTNTNNETSTLDTLGSSSAIELEKTDSDTSSKISEERMKEPEPPAIVPTIQNLDNEKVSTRLTFNDYDAVLDEDDSVKEINAPKTIERLEQVSMDNHLKRKMEEESDDEEDRIQIHTDTIDLAGFDILDLDTNNGTKTQDNELFSLDFEEL